MSLKCKQVLNSGVVRFSDSGKPVSRVAVCGGSGGDFFEQAIANGCDTFVTADVKHHLFVRAKHLGINLFDCGHFATENIIIPVIQQQLEQDFPNLQTIRTQNNKEPFQCL